MQMYHLCVFLLSLNKDSISSSCVALFHYMDISYIDNNQTSAKLYEGSEASGLSQQ